MNFKNITVAGSGVLGSQIAFQTAFHGFNVVVYDINDEAIQKAKERLLSLKADYKKDLNATDDQVDKAYNRITYQSDLTLAVEKADLIIEAIPEIPSVKIDFYTKLSKVANPNTIFATNTSTLLPSQFAEYTGRPEKFLALHFANKIWIHNTAEIMRHPKTDPAVFDQLAEFATAIGMIPILLHKEQPGYILNSLLVPLVGAALDLLEKEVSSVEGIDKTWRIATGSPIGPLEISDVIGIETIYNISCAQAGENNRISVFLKTNYIDKGYLGISTGRGFYDYPKK